MIRVYTDGASRGNPGKAAAGFSIHSSEGKILDEDSCYLGKATNNQAEYRALIMAMEKTLMRSKEAVFFSDSELMVNQLNGVYSVKNPDLKRLFLEAKKFEKNFKKIKYVHVRRENPGISRVDGALNDLLDAIMGR